MKYTLGEKLGIFATKPMGTTSECIGENFRRELCSCGKGHIEYERANGSWVSLHHVSLDSISFGIPDIAPCCADCEKKQIQEWAREEELEL